MLLPGASQLAGTVRAAGTGGPLAGVTVTLANTRGEVVAARSTDAHGRYLITDLAPGRYALALSAPAYQPAALPVTVADGDATTQDAELRSGARVRGTARTTAGDAIPDARVMLLDSDGNVAGLARTGADGRYSFENLPEGDYTVVASGYPPGRQPAAGLLRRSAGARRTARPSGDVILAAGRPPARTAGPGSLSGPRTAAGRSCPARPAGPRSGSSRPAAALALTCSGLVAPAITEAQPGSAARPPMATSRSDARAVGPLRSAPQPGPASRR